MRAVTANMCMEGSWGCICETGGEVVGAAAPSASLQGGLIALNVSLALSPAAPVPWVLLLLHLALPWPITALS